MIDRKSWRQMAEDWLAIQRAARKAKPDDQELGMRMDEIFQAMGDARLLIGRYRKKMAATLWELRAVSRQLGVKAARPLPRSTPSEPRPDTGAYGIKHFDTGAACVECGAEVAAGPGGWRKRAEPGPVCDDCLTAACRPLAASVTVANLMRETGALECARDEDAAALGSMLLTTGLLFERSAFAGIPIRSIDLEKSLLPLLDRLLASTGPVEEEEGEETVAH